MADRCDCIIHGPPDNPFNRRCLGTPTHRLLNEDGEALLCHKHAKALRDMYEPGQIRKLRARPPSSGGEK